MATKKKSTVIVPVGPTPNLLNFNLTELAQFTKEGVYSTNASSDFHLFYADRDDLHDLLKYLLSRVTVSLYLNMYGYDDDELNAIIMAKVNDPSVLVMITLDQSQSGSVHEKALLASDAASDPVGYDTHFVIGDSATGQISHTKGFVADGKVAAEGSTNWDTSAEGTFVIAGKPGGPGYIAQNNTQSVITDADTIMRFQTELIAEHLAAQNHAMKSGSKAISSMKIHGKS